MLLKNFSKFTTTPALNTAATVLVEPNPDWWKELKGKNRNAWILPHCLSTEQKVQIVEFDVSQFIGGIINPEMDKKPSDVSREIPIQPYDRQIKVSTMCSNTL